ncbi:MAG: hypothetical protein HUK21_08985 [Fibrobacteraceae bacterium]|nr:hypothetical protein [Fibrobacteraceae bacterium]MCF0216592.1 hypothetical protein [Fibrobacteraceae bacterium]
MADEINTTTPEEENTAPAVAPVEESLNAEAAGTDAPEQIIQEEQLQQPTRPQVIIQQERGFSHYVGFALLAVLAIGFYFLPGIAVTFGVSQVVDLSGAAAWIFSTILSFVAWLLFKLKIKGFKKSFYWYIALCIFTFAILIAIEVMTEEYAVFSNIFALLTGAKG